MIYMINCSYKGKLSNSTFFLGQLEKDLKKYSDKPCVIKNIKNILTRDFDGFMEDIQGADAIVFGVPLYVDGLPAQVVKLLEMMLDRCSGKLHIPVYVVSNLGFYEPQQISHLFDIVRNWCSRMGTAYSGGIAVGAGPMVRVLKEKNLPAFLNRNVDRGFDSLASAVAKQETVENIYCRSSVPRWLYLEAAHRMFDKEISKQESK